MLRLVLPLCLLLAACGGSRDLDHRSPPPGAVWQQGPAGWVYGPSPLELWPSGFRNSEITRLPDRVLFGRGQGALDRNGRQVALLQGQRLRLLPNHEVTLFCGWSAAEETSLGMAAAHDLAGERCAAVAAVYRSLGVPGRQLHHRLVPPPAAADGQAADDAGRQSVRITVVATAAGRRLPYREVEPQRNPMLGQRHGILLYYARYDDRQRLFLPEAVYFAWGSAELDANARALLNTFADWILPDESFVLFLNCDQVAGERPSDEAQKGLARDRCLAVRQFLIDRGLCAGRIVHGPGGRSLGPLYVEPYDLDDQSVGAWLDQSWTREGEAGDDLPCEAQPFSPYQSE